MTVVIHRRPARQPRGQDALIKEAWDRRRRRLRFSLLLVLVIGAGLGSPVTRRLALVPLALLLTPAASAALPNPCVLLTNAEVAKVIGNKAETRTPSGNGRFRMCSWTGPPLGSFSESHAQLLVQVTRETKAQFEKVANATQGAVRVRGAGDSAYATTGAAKYLEVWQKGYALMIMATFVTDTLQAEKVAAKAVFGHL